MCVCVCVCVRACVSCLGSMHPRVLSGFLGILLDTQAWVHPWVNSLLFHKGVIAIKGPGVGKGRDCGE